VSLIIFDVSISGHLCKAVQPERFSANLAGLLL
jgi:hypothetical protein